MHFTSVHQVSIPQCQIGALHGAIVHRDTNDIGIQTCFTMTLTVTLAHRALPRSVPPLHATRCPSSSIPEAKGVKGLREAKYCPQESESGGRERGLEP